MGCCTEPAAVHIAHVMQRLHFFQFFNFFYNLHDLPQKKITLPYRKNKKFIFFNIHTTYSKKNYTHLQQKKLHDYTVFLYTTYIFHPVSQVDPCPDAYMPHPFKWDKVGSKCVGTYGDLSGPTETYGDLSGPLGAYGGPLASMGTFGDPLAPMGTSRGLWAPMAAYGGLWGPLGTHWPLWGPMGTYRGLWGGGHHFFAHPFGHHPPPLSSKHQIYIRHITHLVVYTAKTTCHIRHQTLYTILPWPYQNSFLGLDFVSSANDSM